MPEANLPGLEELLGELNRLVASVERLAAQAHSLPVAPTPPQAQSRPVATPSPTISGEPLPVPRQTALFGYRLIAEFMVRRPALLEVNRVNATQSVKNNKSTITFHGERFDGTFAYFYTSDTAEGADIDASGTTVLNTIPSDQTVKFVVVYKAKDDEPVAVGTPTKVSSPP